MAVPYYSEGNTDRNAPSQHPISPPSELVQRWTHFATENGLVDEEIFAAHAAQWGADRELEACCEWLDLRGFAISTIDALRAARRPKPPSLKEQALARTTAILNDPNRALLIEVRETLELNLRALEALPNE